GSRRALPSQKRSASGSASSTLRTRRRTGRGARGRCSRGGPSWCRRPTGRGGGDDDGRPGGGAPRRAGADDRGRPPHPPRGPHVHGGRGRAAGARPGRARGAGARPRRRGPGRPAGGGLMAYSHSREKWSGHAQGGPVDLIASPRSYSQWWGRTTATSAAGGMTAVISTWAASSKSVITLAVETQGSA